MSSFAINGRLGFDPVEGFSALASAIPTVADAAGAAEIRCRRVHESADPRVHVLELVAALAREIRLRGDRVETVDID